MSSKHKTMRYLSGGLVFLTMLAASSGAEAGDGIAKDATWSEIRQQERSFVFGRVEGRFDGPQYRGKKLRVRNKATEKEYLIELDRGLGYFYASLPTGTYQLVSLEAMYFPRMRPMHPTRYPPVRQRYTIRPMAKIGLPSFPVVTETPLYLGTIHSTVGHDGLVYEGHSLEIVDDYERAIEHVTTRFPVFMDSLRQSGVSTERFFFVRPTNPGSVASSVSSVEDPVKRAREYLLEGRHQQAIDWLMTFMPTNDDERVTIRLLIGEAKFAQKRYEEAIEEIGEALRDDPENLRALRLLARAHAMSGNRENAFELYAALAEAIPDDAEASLHLGYQFALESKEDEATKRFETALRESDDFDYLLYDLTPYALALSDEATYVPPEPVSGIVQTPSTLRTRRASGGGLAVLVDHRGHVVAAHVAEDSNHWASAVMMSMIRGRFKPASLNGVPIPCLIILGPGRDAQAVQ